MNGSSTQPRISFFKRLLVWWVKSEQYVAYALFVLVAIAEHFSIPFVRDSALSVLGIIILREVFDIAKDRTRLKDVLTRIDAGVDELGHAIHPRKRFNNISEAIPTILDCIRECNEADNRVEIHWIGMTMWNAGSSLIFGFNELATEGAVRELHLKLAMIDGAWIDSNLINKAWNSKRVESSKLNIEQSFANKKAAGFNWDCAIKHYAHMPGIHGGLINGKYLFLGMAQWLDGDMHAGERQYSFYINQSKDDREKVRIFEGWFNVCYNGRDDRPSAESAAHGA